MCFMTLGAVLEAALRLMMSGAGTFFSGGAGVA
jgi:hypothetical protein